MEKLKMIDFLKFLLGLDVGEFFKLVGIFLVFGFILFIIIYFIVKFTTINKVSKDGFECNNNKQDLNLKYAAWAYGIEPYFRTILGLSRFDINYDSFLKKEALEKYYKAECLTYNRLLQKHILHHFFPFISADTLSQKEIKDIKGEVL